MLIGKVAEMRGNLRKVLFAVVAWALSFQACFAQTSGVGIWGPLSGSSQIANPVAGYTIYFDAVLHRWFFYNGSGYAEVSPPAGSTQTRAPLATDDNTQGWNVRSIWTNTSSGISYICSSNATGAAVWNPITNPITITVPSWLTVNGSSSASVSSGGTIAYATASQSANQFLASPNGASGVLSPRSILNADLPILSMAVGGMGTALSPVAGGVFYSTASNGALTLPGTSNQVLLGGSTPAFGIAPAAAGGLGVNASTWAVGTLPYFSGSLFGGMAPTADGQVPKWSASAQQWQPYTLPSNTVMVPSHANVRLYGVSGNPKKQVTGATSIYAGPYKGAVVDLYYGGQWLPFVFSELSYSLSGLIPHTLYDVYIYAASGTTPTIFVQAASPSQAATNNPGAGSSVVVNMANTSAFTVGDNVCVYTSGANEVATITAISANTSITLQKLVNSYTTPTIYDLNSRSSAATQTLLNGRYVLSSDNTKLYVGSFSPNTATTVNDNASSAMIYSYFNHDPRDMFVVNTTGVNAGYNPPTNFTIGTYRAEMLLGEQEHSITADFHGMMAWVTVAAVDVSLDTIALQYVAGSSLQNNGNTYSEAIVPPMSVKGSWTTPSVGYHYVQEQDTGLVLNSASPYNTYFTVTISQ